MNRALIIIICLIAVFLLTPGILFIASANHAEHDGKKHKHEKKNSNHIAHKAEKNTSPINHPLYKETCGACHFAYHPELLPAGSWNNILSAPENHFGEAIVIDPNSLQNICEYLTENAADASSTHLAKKIMKSIGGQIPLRITSIPYIQKKHRKIGNDILRRPSIGSLSNCPKCHAYAENGIFDDENVTIPE